MDVVHRPMHQLMLAEANATLASLTLVSRNVVRWL